MSEPSKELQAWMAKRCIGVELDGLGCSVNGCSVGRPDCPALAEMPGRAERIVEAVKAQALFALYRSSAKDRLGVGFCCGENVQAAETLREIKIGGGVGCFLDNDLAMGNLERFRKEREIQRIEEEKP